MLHLKRMGRIANRRMKGRLERLGRTGCGCGCSGDSRVERVESRRGGIRFPSDGGWAREGAEGVHEGFLEGVLEDVLEGIGYPDGERARRVLNQTCQASTSVCWLTLRNRLSI